MKWKHKPSCVASAFAAALVYGLASLSNASDPVGLTPTEDDVAALAAKRGYSPYAGRGFPTQVYWGDTRVHTDNSQDAEGKTQEKVYNVVWGDAESRTLRSDGSLPAVGNTVDVENAAWSNTIGDPELIAVWSDPDFDPTERAFYYGRVLEIPTPRWTAYDAMRFGVEPPEGTEMIHQERPYTSPIWYTPV